MTANKYPRHDFWGAGEADCPRDLKASNGELHTMRCKVCGGGWRDSVDVCMAQITTLGGGIARGSAASALVLRCCAPDMTSQFGFVWPGVGQIAEAPDWIDNDECGNGLHGWLRGEGDPCTTDYYNREGAKWLVVEVEESTLRFPRCRPEFPRGQVKFQRGLVRFVGTETEARAYLLEQGNAGVTAVHHQVPGAIVPDAGNSAGGM